MKKNLKSVDIANSVRMMRPLHEGTILLVEGGNDSLVYSSFINQRKCRLIIGHGKENVLGALEILDREAFLGVIAIIDTDFWKLDGLSPSSTNIFLTDTHDLETMILKSHAFNKILSEYGSVKKIEFINNKGVDIRTYLLQKIKIMGCFRWYSLRERLELNFEGLVFSRFVDKNTLKLDVLKMIKIVFDHSKRHELKAEALRNSLETFCQSSLDLWHICCGHDVVNLLLIGFQKVLGSHSSASLKSEEIERSFRLAYEEAYFRESELYKAIMKWQEHNGSFAVF